MIYMFLANGMEEVEALCPLDIIRRAGLDITTVGIGGREITGAHNITVKADIADTELKDVSADLIFLPGGMPGTLNLAASDTVKNAIETALKNDSYIAAICAAPSILGDMGILDGKEGEILKINHPRCDWRAQITHGKKIGIGTDEYNLIEI